MKEYFVFVGVELEGALELARNPGPCLSVCSPLCFTPAAVAAAATGAPTNLLLRRILYGRTLDCHDPGQREIDANLCSAGTCQCPVSARTNQRQHFQNLRHLFVPSHGVFRYLALFLTRLEPGHPPPCIQPRVPWESRTPKSSPLIVFYPTDTFHRPPTIRTPDGREQELSLTTTTTTERRRNRPTGW